MIRGEMGRVETLSGRLSLRPRFVALAMLVAAVFAILALAHSQGPNATTAASAELQVQEDYGRLPMSFEPNAGRTDARADFISRGAGYSLFLTSGGAVMDLATSKKRGNVIEMNLVGSDPAAPATGLAKLPGTTNSLIGDDASKWRHNIPTYERVHYEDVYPGIAVDWYGRQNTLEHDFRIAPGADPGQIKVSMRGANSLTLAPNGDLLIGASGKTLRQRAPVAFQRIGGSRRSVESGYEIHNGVVSFQLGKYDHSRPLTIDPILLAYSTFIGGNGIDNQSSIAFDYQGDAYLFGITESSDFPTTPGAYDGTWSTPHDAYVVKLSSSGDHLIYGTFIGSGDALGNETIGKGTVDPLTGEAFLDRIDAQPELPDRRGVLRAE